MKLFVYEHITSGALAEQEIPASLAREGDEMLSTVLHDCRSLPNLQLTILRDARLATFNNFDNNTHYHCHTCSQSIEFQNAWTQSLNNCDAIFIIAPESNGVLMELQQQAINHGKIILGCQPSAIAVTSNKLDCERLLNNHKIATPKSCLASNWDLEKFDHSTGYIVKPIDGAGCLDTLLFNHSSELLLYLQQQPLETLHNVLVQEYIPGVAASLSLLFSNDDVLVLAINSQEISCQSNTLRFNGCIVNGIDSTLFSFSKAASLARQIQQAISGLWGFVGIDLILTESDVTVIDINPRLTTSYVGLQRSLSLNPMELLFSIKEGGMPVMNTAIQRKRVSIVV